MKVTQLNSFPLKTHLVILCWFYRLSDLKKCTQTSAISVNLNLTKTKRTLSEVSVWIYWTCNRICGLHINSDNAESYTGNEPALFSSAERLKQSAVPIQPRIPFMNWNNGKCTDWRYDGVVTRQEILNERVSIEHLQFKLDEIENNYLIQKLVFCQDSCLGRLS